MGAFALVFHRDGSVVEASEVKRLLDPIASRGMDGSRTVLSGPFGVGALEFWTTPEDVGEFQPVVDPRGQFLFLLDGRLDNREELLAALDCPSMEARPLSDAVVAFRCFEKWGQKAWERFVGPFVLCVVDLLARRVVAARDHLGDRSLVYFLTPRLLVLASEEAAILACPEVSSDLNETSLARYFALRPPCDGQTLFREVRELPPASVMDVDPLTSNVRRYWRAEGGFQFGRDEKEWIEEYRTVLTEAVRCRLRTSSPPAALLSGGLDSSPVVALAAKELEHRGSPTPLRTISWVFDELQECDERPWIEAMTREFGLDSVHFTADGCWPLSDLSSFRRTLPAPPGAFCALQSRAYHEASSRGHRILLVGASGDQLYGRWALAFLHMIRERRMGTLVSEIWKSVRIWGPRALWVHPAARRLGREILTSLSGSSTSASAPDGPPWLTDDAKTLVRPTLTGDGSSRGVGAFAALSSRNAYGCSREAGRALHQGVDVRDPFRDRRLVELMLRMPCHLLLRNGLLKHVTRAAMSGLLPESVRLRSVNSSLTPLYRRGLLERESATLRRWLFDRKGLWQLYVRAESLDAVLHDGLASREDHVALLPWTCASMEIWYRLSPEFTGGAGGRK